MYEKVKKLKKFVCKDSSQRIIAILFATIFIISFVYTDTDAFFDIFCYPEETYQILEKEADVLVKTNSFETNYDLVVTNYDFHDKTLSMELSSSLAQLNITIKNYGQSDQEYYRSRAYDSAVPYILWNVFGLLLLTTLVCSLGVLIVLILANVIQFIAFIIHKIIKVARKK